MTGQVVEYKEGTSEVYTLYTQGNVYMVANWYVTAGSAQEGLDYTVSEPVGVNYLVGTGAPETQHVIYFQFLDDNIAEERETFDLHVEFIGYDADTGAYLNGEIQDYTFVIVDDDTACFIDLNSDGVEGPVELTFDDVHKNITKLESKLKNYEDQIKLGNQMLSAESDEADAIRNLARLGVADTMLSAVSLGVSNLGKALAVEVPALAQAIISGVEYGKADSVEEFIAATAGLAESLVKSAPIIGLIANSKAQLDKAYELAQSAHELVERVKDTKEQIDFAQKQYDNAKADLDLLRSCANNAPMTVAEPHSAIRVQQLTTGATETVLSDIGVTLVKGSPGSDIVSVTPGGTPMTVVDLQDGNDVLTVNLSTHIDSLLVVSGGAGIDTVHINAASTDFLWSPTGDDTAALTNYKDQNLAQMMLVDVERIEFTNGRAALDIEGTNGAGAAYRIYQAAFDRTPDVGGLTFWVEQADKGMSTIEMAARFIDSNEFRNLYGSSSPPAEQFIELIYQNVLHRDPDQGGHDYWAGQLAQGMSEAEMLARFADSPENRADVADVIVQGIWLNPEGDYAS
jgi:hypothetical protein